MCGAVRVPLDYTDPDGPRIPLTVSRARASGPAAGRQGALDVRTGPGVLPPVLLLAAERDAATPYAGALELQRRLSGSVLVTERDAGTHGVAGGPNACVNGYLERYLLTGAVPAAENGPEMTPVRRASCAPHPEPDPVSLDGRATKTPAV